MAYRRLSGRPAHIYAWLLAGAALPALAAAASAQVIETVTVSAERRLEDLQAVPMAVTAFQAADISQRRIEGVRDIQFATPSVNYTKNNFTSSNFSIRGVGTQVISADSEFGVAFNIDDVYYAVPPIDSAQFYDLERIEVLRGPQSTLYGRGATGGAVNVFTARPQLYEQSASFSATYGNYNAAEVKAMVNLPLIDGELGFRLAGDWVRHDGWTRNIYGPGRPPASTHATCGRAARACAGSRAKTPPSTSSPAMPQRPTAACAARSSFAIPTPPARWVACLIAPAAAAARSTSTPPSSTSRFRGRRWA